MAQKGKKKTALRRSGVSARHLPVKRSINLIEVSEKGINWGAALPMILLILLLAAALAKFGVVDRLESVYAAQSETNAVRAQLEEERKVIESFGDLADTYAHYTYEDMTAEELDRSNRYEVTELIRRVVAPEATVESWSVAGNMLTLNLTGRTLQGVNLIAQKLEADDLVSFCSVTAAATDEQQPESGGAVRANIVIYLNGALEGGGQG